ncbi:SRPBCC family protein [Billgrantia endophytica]|uniref:Polyketide cyclase n=1 Tax=Billgrantia endophytica TaxID=2033802 RepID=A0A2N7U7X7_9GAMM|nr:SRPBCC family protein [Halomonas endophytica]PMR76554.1 polyketide cyclase [Halomonas endophytica]
MAEFRFVTTWRIGAPISDVYEVLTDSPHWPDWWSSVADVRLLAAGDEEGIGRAYRYTWKSRLGYRLRFDIRVTRVKVPSLIEGVASGDVKGVGSWQLVEEGRITRVRYVWEVRTMRRWMNLFARVARPLIIWNHHAVMQDGAEGLAQHLNRPLLQVMDN